MIGLSILLSITIAAAPVLAAAQISSVASLELLLHAYLNRDMSTG